MRILHLIDSLDSSDCARQLPLLCARGAEVCCLGPDTPLTRTLQDGGVAVHSLHWTRWIDPSVIVKLRRILRDARPEVIHVWRLPALRLLAVAAPEWLPRVVLNRPRSASWWDDWLLGQVRCVDVPAGVVDIESSSAKEAAFGALIVCASPLERSFGVRNAIWAIDIIRYLFADARLQIAGGAVRRSRIFASLAIGLQNDAVEFVEPQANRLQSAGIVWVPSVADCGASIALEAMAHGRAVIASDVPCLRELIDDNATGILVPPGDVVALARRTRLLLEDQTVRKRLGDEARDSVRWRFPIARAVERWREVYRQVAA